MAKVFPGRYTAHPSEPFLVFLIGMRINNLWAIHKWWPTLMAMGPMIASLVRYPEKGLLGWHSWFAWRQVMLVQYWRTFDDLERFARSASEPHLSAWKRFNQTIGADGTVGFWHETYLVPAGQSESVYGNMPVFGLAQATLHKPAEGRRETARRRLGGHNEPAVPSPTTPSP